MDVRDFFRLPVFLKQVKVHAPSRCTVKVKPIKTPKSLGLVRHCVWFYSNGKKKSPVLRDFLIYLEHLSNALAAPTVYRKSKS